MDDLACRNDHFIGRRDAKLRVFKCPPPLVADHFNDERIVGFFFSQLITAIPGTHKALRVFRCIVCVPDTLQRRYGNDYQQQNRCPDKTDLDKRVAVPLRGHRAIIIGALAEFYYSKGESPTHYDEDAKCDPHREHE